eukprot:gene1338-11420_t
MKQNCSEEALIIIDPTPIQKKRIQTSTDEETNKKEVVIEIDSFSPSKKIKLTKTQETNISSSIDLTDEEFSIESITPTLISTSWDLTGEDPKNECKICYDDEVSIYEMSYFKNCEHCCCNECFKKIAKSKIEEKSFPINCPFCKTELADNDLQSNISVDLYKKFEDFRLAHFLEKTQEFKCCLTPSCTNGVFWSQNGNEENAIWKCSQCKKKYCLKCSDVDHSGTCEQFKQWKIDNGESDSKLEELLKNRTFRKCPGCSSPTQKKDGCNGMTCSRCKTQWCWNCEKKNTECTCEKK